MQNLSGKLTSRLVKMFFPVLLLLAAHTASATHLAGGSLTYEYLGSDNYRVTLTLLQDCLTGDPDAITDDNPAYIFVFKSTGQQLNRDSITSQTSINSPVNFTGCGSAPATCINKVTASKIFHLPVITGGYTLVWVRCCRNGDIVNIANPGSVGSSLVCNINPTSTTYNSSATFTDWAQQIVCTNSSFTIDNSASDADGDSLSYEFCNVFVGGKPDDAKPRSITPPPYQPVNYTGGHSYTSPIGGIPAISIDQATGMVTLRPNLTGKYLVAVACSEWRAGVKINTIRKEYEVLVTNCPGTLQPYTLDTTILAGQTINFSASAGGLSYAWHPGIYLSDSTIPNPSGFFPDAGNFSYDLETGGAGGCARNDTIKVHVATVPVLFMPTAFSPNGDGVNDIFKPKSVGPYVIKYLKIFDRNGQLISNDISGWDGSYKGAKADMGSYIWTMQYVDKDGVMTTTKGTVTLIR